jgi:hypothetical protein
MTAGRPTIYNEEILTKITEYIDSCKDIEADPENKITRKVNIPTIEGLAVYLHINKDTIYTWRKEKPAFSELISVLLDEQAKRLVNNGLAGTYNPTIAKVLLTKHGYTEKTETDITSKGESINPVLVKFIDGKDN